MGAISLNFPILYCPLELWVQNLCLNKTFLTKRGCNVGAIAPTLTPPLPGEDKGGLVVASGALGLESISSLL